MNKESIGIRTDRLIYALSKRHARLHPELTGKFEINLQDLLDLATEEEKKLIEELREQAKGGI